MKLSVLVPSIQYKSYAGARIRYGRVAPMLTQHGVELKLEDIGHFDPTATSTDAVLISKCHDARSLLVAAALRDRRKLVGVDLFDDYFSQRSDGRLARYRSWLAQLVGMCDFAICSTPTIAEALLPYRDGLPTHILNDPASAESDDQLSRLVSRKIAEARDSERIRIAWFGVGDNRYFPVGLSDLAAHGSALRELARSGMAVELTVVSNARALTADGLSVIRQLPIETKVKEWSETAERELLEEALVAFLPVGCQPFSRAKSLNRAFTALSAGCQVLSVGYPLYAPLGDLIYREAGELVADLVRSSFRLRPETVSKYNASVERLASAEGEARALAAFLVNLRPGEGQRPLMLSLIHGHSTMPQAHGLVRSLNGLSVASPFSSAPLDFDVLFRAADSGLTMLVSRNASRRMLPQVQERLEGRERIGGEQYLRVRDERPVRRAVEWGNLPISVQLATYASAMREIERRMTDSFGPVRTILSETSPLFPNMVVQ